MNKMGVPKNPRPDFSDGYVFIFGRAKLKKKSGKTGPAMYNLIKMLTKHLTTILPEHL